MKKQHFLLAFLAVLALPFWSRGQCDLSLEMTVSNASPAIYKNVDYVLTLKNAGPQAATGITVIAPTDFLKGSYGLVLTAVTPQTGSWNVFDQIWTVGNLAAGAQTKLTLTLFTMKNALPVVFAQVKTASPTDVDSTPGNDTNKTANEDDEAILGGLTPPQPCLVDLETVEKVCTVLNGEDYYTFKMLATSTDPTVQFLELSYDPNFFSKNVVVNGVPFSPPLSPFFANQVSFSQPFWVRPLGQPTCIARDTARPPAGCGDPEPPIIFDNGCIEDISFQDVWCNSGTTWGFSVKVAAPATLDAAGGYQVFLNSNFIGNGSFDDVFNAGLNTGLPFSSDPAVPDTVQIVSLEDPTCGSKRFFQPFYYCLPPDQTSCFQQAIYPWEDWIKRVQFDGIDNPSGKSKVSNFGLDGFTTQPIYATVTAGDVVPFSITAGYSWVAYNEFVRVWLDKNRDGAYDANELVFEGQVPSPVSGPNVQSTLSGSITIPEDAFLGTTSMKIVLKRGSYPTVCEAVPYGEVEIYSVKILGGIGTGSPCDAFSTTILGTRCSDNGTPDSPGDDTYFIKYRCDLPGSEGGVVRGFGSWIDANGNFQQIPNGTITSLTSMIGTAGEFGPIMISQFPKIRFSVNMNEPPSCFETILTPVDAPAPCSAGGPAPPPTANCAAASDYPWEDWISKVKIGAFENASGKTTYGNFKGQTVPLIKGNPTAATFTASWSYYGFQENFRAWIDYDHDGLFEASEIAFEGIVPKPTVDGIPFGSVSGTITAPATALGGATVMRVMMRRNAFGQPCGNIPTGEVEDYGVTILTALAAADDRKSDVFESKSFDFTLFPNPTTDRAELDLTQFLDKKVNVRVTDALGQTVFSTKMEEVKKPIFEIDLSQKMAGAYFVWAQAEGQRAICRRLLVVRL